jgi:hypothetical protein
MARPTRQRTDLAATPIRWRSYRLTKVRQAVGENARLGPLVFFESRTPTALASNATSTQLLVPLSPL